MYLFLLGILFGSGAVLAFQELRRQVSTRMEDWVQAETDRRMQSMADLKGWGYVQPKPKDSTLSEYDDRLSMSRLMGTSAGSREPGGDNGATIASTPDEEW